MTWFDLAWAAVVVVLITALVGGGIAWSVGLRGFWIVGAAPAFALTVVAGSAIVAPMVGVPWSILPVLVIGAVIAGAALVIRRAVRTPTTVPSAGEKSRGARLDGWLIAALVLAAFLIAWRFVEIVGRPDAISQTFDAIFHLNAVRYVLDTQNASSLHIGTMTSPGGGLPFYPAAWHAWAALAVQLTGVSVPTATLALTVVTSAVFWPVAIVLLSRVLFGRSPVVAVSAGVLSAAIAAYPVLMYDYGVLYPMLLGFAMLPFALAVVARILGVVRPAPPTGWLLWTIVLVGAVTGMTLAHPGAFVALVAFTVPMVLVFWVARFRSASRPRRGLWVAALVGYLVVGALIVIVLRPPSEARGWPISMSMFDALADILTVSMWYQEPAWLVAIAVIIGIVWAIIDRSRVAIVALGMYAIAAWLFFVVAALPLFYVRDAFTGPWYNNLPRIAALLAITMVPIAVYGIHRTAQWAATLAWTAPLRSAPRALQATVGIAVVILAVVATQVGAMSKAVQWAAPLYALDEDAPLLDADEFDVIERLADHVPEGSVVAVNGWNGGALAYALTGIPVTRAHALVEIGPELQVVDEALVSGDIDATACEALDALDIRFVLDFGTDGVHGPVDGFPGLESSSGVEVVDQSGDARLYEITACGS